MCGEMEASVFEHDNQARQRFAECLEEGTPEQAMVGWLNESLHRPEAMAGGYLYYVGLEKEANQMRLKHDGDPATAWLSLNYYLPVCLFYGAMERYCWEKACHALKPACSQEPGGEEISDDVQKAFQDLIRKIASERRVAALPRTPEFILDDQKLKQLFAADKPIVEKSSKEHGEHAGRIDRLCADELLSLPEEIRWDYRSPLCELANAHRNIASSAEFSPYYMLDDPLAYLK